MFRIKVFVKAGAVKKTQTVLVPRKMRGYPVQNYADTVNMTLVDKVNEIIHNGEMEISYDERRNGDVPYLVADTTTAETILNFQPQYTLDDIIESMKNG